jgi:hypothetical protein
MLANSINQNIQAGSLNGNVHLHAASLLELISFIASELPRWRDHPDRSNQNSETALTSQLCGHLTTAARFSDGWDFLQFRIEEPDEKQKGRKIDLVASPCGPTVWIDGRRCTQFDTLLPIECKRLPTPKDKGRDEREYVINRNATTGGIQRFKAGHHGSVHSRAVMIGYVQDESPDVWYNKLSSWIIELAQSNHANWTSADLLLVDPIDVMPEVAVYRSSHSREKGLPKIDIHHLWIAMT